MYEKQKNRPKKKFKLTKEEIPSPPPMGGRYVFSVILGEPGKSLIAFGEAAKQLVSQVPQSDLQESS